MVEEIITTRRPLINGINWYYYDTLVALHPRLILPIISIQNTIPCHVCVIEDAYNSIVVNVVSKIIS